MTNAAAGASTQVYRVYIKATPQAIWDAITKPEWTAQYGYGGISEYPSAPGPYRILPDEMMRTAREGMGGTVLDVIVDGEVIEYDPPRRLALTWRMLMDPNTAAEGFTNLTYEIEEAGGGVSKLTVTHDLERSPRLAAFVSGEMERDGAGGGWAFVLSDLKSLLETGQRLPIWGE